MHRWIGASVGISLLGVAWLSAQPRLKIHISVDMEGIAGVVTGEQLSPAGFEYARFREFMTAEANTAIQAALAAGATDIVVADAHGNMQNLLVEKLPKNVTLVRGNGPRPLGMMQGIDGTFDAAMFIGYHASTTNAAGVRAHTISSASLTDVRLNGRSMPEAGLNAAVAGHFNVPVVMISGDDAIVAEAQQLLGNIEGAVVKWAYGFHAARTLTPEAANQVIADAVRRALARRAEFKPYKPASPMQLEVRFKNYRPAEVLALLPFIERADAHAVRYRPKDALEMAHFMSFVTNYAITLEP
jgi:D-amino peptidase